MFISKIYFEFKAGQIIVVAIVTNICTATNTTRLNPIPNTNEIIKEKIIDRIMLPKNKFLKPILSQLSDVLPSLLLFL